MTWGFWTGILIDRRDASREQSCEHRHSKRRLAEPCARRMFRQAGTDTERHTPKVGYWYAAGLRELHEVTS